MQATDGNLVIYGPNGFARGISSPRGAGAYLLVQTDGSAVVYPKSGSGYTPWATYIRAVFGNVCLDTLNYSACLTSDLGSNPARSTAISYDRSYSCKDFVLGPAICGPETDGSYWNSTIRSPRGTIGAWEDWANTSFTYVGSPLVKACVYLRRDITKWGEAWTRESTGPPIPGWQSC